MISGNLVHIDFGFILSSRMVNFETAPFKITNDIIFLLGGIEGEGFKRFRENSQACLAGEDQGFVKNFMSKKGTSIFKPVEASEIFPKDHYSKFSFDK